MSTVGPNGIEKLDSVTFDSLLKAQDPFSGGLASLDLTGIRFISPSALTQLAAVCYTAKKAGQHLTINVPDGSVRNYLLRASFMSVVEEAVASIVPAMPDGISMFYDNRRGSNPLLIELTKIESGSDLPKLLEQIVKVLRFRLKYKKYDAFDVATVVSELAQNTFDHNANTCGFLAMQVFGRGSNRFLEIGVSDFGDGLAATLRRNAKNSSVHSDIEAIRLSTQLGTSEHDDPTRGTGLYHLLEIAYKHGGSVQIRSGSGKIRYRMDKKVGWTFNVPQMRGVQVALTLSTKAVDRTPTDDTL